jgi:hypothetical protein
MKSLRAGISEQNQSDYNRNQLIMGWQEDNRPSTDAHRALSLDYEIFSFVQQPP